MLITRSHPFIVIQLRGAFFGFLSGLLFFFFRMFLLILLYFIIQLFLELFVSRITLPFFLPESIYIDLLVSKLTGDKDNIFRLEIRIYILPEVLAAPIVDSNLCRQIQVAGSNARFREGQKELPLFIE